MEITNCPNCQFPIADNFRFCPNCGKEVNGESILIPISKQITTYLISFFLPPLGLIPGIKYLRQKNDQAKKVGLIAIILTILSVIITIITVIGFISQFNQTYGQFSQLKDLGF